MPEVVMDRASRTGRELAALLAGGPPGTINWTGAPLSEGEPPILNARSRTNKLAQLAWLEIKGVSVPPWDFSPGPGRWLPRTLFHQQGRDFTSPPREPDFWVKHLDLTSEWRLHFCRTRKGNLKLLRSGVKVPKPGAHPWVRSHRLGWKISYTGGAPEELVNSARLAMQALELDFGAVDIALAPDTHYVLEVNTCPGLDSGTLRRYAEAILERLD